MITEFLPPILASAAHQVPTAVGWWYFPSALVLGALHGLEPGHSKTMMAAFIVAVRGTVRQAVLLGLAATASHTLVIWVLAAITLAFKDQIRSEDAEPWLKAASGVMVIVLALWMAWRIRRDTQGFPRHSEDSHHHDHGHHHGVGSEWDRDMDVEDAHAQAHADEIKKRFASQHVTTWQIFLFGLSGGLLPCPGALTVALLCLQTNRAALGFALVLAFSIGLAVTLVTVGALAAWGAQHARSKLKRFDPLIARLPYLSVVVLLVIGSFLLFQGLHSLKNNPF